MASVNKVIIVGRLGKDPELRYSQGGAPICSFSVATDESYKDRDGNKVERTEWHNITVFQRMAEHCANYLAKGSLVYIEGSLKTDKWQDKDGNDRYTTKITAQRVQFLDRKQDGEGRGDSGGQQPRQQAQGQGQRGGNSRGQQGGRGGNDSDDLGPVLPSEGGDLDSVPF